MTSVAQVFADLGQGASAGRLASGALFLQQGPINLVVAIDADSGARRRAEDGLMAVFPFWLGNLVAELPRLRCMEHLDLELPGGVIAREMAQAVSAYRDGGITPMAAVAGAIADAALEQITREPGIDRAWVNNGGDIAVHLAGDATFTAGIVSDAGRGEVGARVRIDASMPVRGVATSGWRGRSHSLGIADAVTVLASTAARADAAATAIASATDVDHHAIERTSARDLVDDSDLGERRVTTDVGPLDDAACRVALDNGEALAQRALDEGHIAAAAICVQGRWCFVGAPLKRRIALVGAPVRAPVSAPLRTPAT